MNQAQVATYQTEFGQDCVEVEVFSIVDEFDHKAVDDLAKMAEAGGVIPHNLLVHHRCPEVIE